MKGKRTSVTYLSKVERPRNYDIRPTTKPEPHVGVLDGVSDDESPAGIISHDMAEAPEYLFDVLNNHQICKKILKSVTHIVDICVGGILLLLSRGHDELPEDFVIVSRLVVDVALVDTVAIRP